MLQRKGSRHMGVSSCNAWAQQLQTLGSRAQSLVVVYTSLVTLRHVGSFWIRDQTYVFCTSRWVFTTDSSGKLQCRERLRKKKPSFFEVKNNFGGKLLKNYRGHLGRNSKEKGKVDRDQFSHAHPPVGNKWGRKHYNPGD